MAKATQLTRGDQTFFTPGTRNSAPRFTRMVMMNQLEEASKQIKLAESLSVEAINIRIKLFPENHESIASARDLLAYVLIDEGDDLGAIQCLNAAIHTWRLHLPITAHELAFILTDLAAVEAGQEHFEEASMTIREANRIFKLHAGSDDLLFAHMLADRTVDLYAGDRALEAIPLLQAVYEITKRQLGSNDQFTERVLERVS
jgi:hypothetical protein